MLILFSAKNYRSIRDEQELNLVASPYYSGKKSDMHARENRERQLIKKSLPGLSGKSFLRSIAIYGANGSGKSNVIHAMRTMQKIVCDSSSYAPDDSLPYNPFILDENSKTQPTEFFAAFEWGGIRYEYEFSYDSKQIVEEQLCSFPKGLRRTLYTRTADAGSRSAVQDSSYLPIDKVIATMLNPNMLLLSLLYGHPGVQGFDTIKPVGDFFKNGLIVLDQVRNRWLDFPVSGEVLDGELGTDYERDLVQKMMQDSDIGITKANVVRKPAKQSSNEGNENGADVVRKTVVLQHAGTAGAGSINLMDESLGTMQMFYLSSFIGEALENDATLVVDELDASMHPILSKQIVEMFERKELADRSAQLIFTAHQTYLMSGGTLERDQIWLTDKGPDGGTVLYPLSDYSPRKGEPIARGYLLGRYAAVPVLPEDFGMLPSSGKEGEGNDK